MRLALGARPIQVLWSVIRDALVTIMAGMTIGLPLVWALSRLAQSLLFGVGPTDVLTSLAPVVVLTAFGLVAALVPAWRAAHVQPVVALRCE